MLRVICIDLGDSRSITTHDALMTMMLLAEGTSREFGRLSCDRLSMTSRSAAPSAAFAASVGVMRAVDNGAFTTLRGVQRVSPVRAAGRVHMGLNAKNLAKSKQGGKKKSGKGKGKTASKTTGGGGIDTNRQEYIFQMSKVSKTFRNGKTVLKNINLAYFPGVRIGIVGANGSGKSTLLKIMAGIDTDYDGFALPQAGKTVGYLAQEPELPEKTVEGNINAAVAETRGLLDRYAELGTLIGKDGISDEEREKITTEWSRLQDRIEAQNGWELDRNIERALEALRCPPGEALVDTLSGGERRRVALCALLLKRYAARSVFSALRARTLFFRRLHFSDRVV